MRDDGGHETVVYLAAGTGFRAGRAPDGGPIRKLDDWISVRETWTGGSAIRIVPARVTTPNATASAPDALRRALISPRTSSAAIASSCQSVSRNGRRPAAHGEGSANGRVGTRLRGRLPDPVPYEPLLDT
jgi:hypothetical protein